MQRHTQKYVVPTIWNQPIRPLPVVTEVGFRVDNYIGSKFHSIFVGLNDFRICFSELE